MDEMHKEMLETFFNTAQLMLAKNGQVRPLYILIKGKETMPVLHEGGLDMIEYANAVIEYASDNDMDAAVLICEQDMLMGKKSAPDMQPYINSEKSISEHPDSRPHLTGILMTAEGVYNTMVAEIHIEPSNGTKYIFEPIWLEDTKTNFLMPWRK